MSYNIMSLFYGYTEEDEHRQINSKLTFTHIWSYEGLWQSFEYPTHAKDFYPSNVMVISNPSKEAKVILVGLCVDDDSGGLNSSDTLEFQMRYVTMENGSPTQVLNHKTIFTADLSKYTQYRVNDGRGLLHNYNFSFVYNLSQNISNYEDIKTISIGIRHSVGILHGNETSLICLYDDVLKQIV